MAFPREYTTTRCFSSRLNPSILKPVFVGHGVLSPLSILNMSVLRSKGTVIRVQQPGGSGITQSIPVLGSADVGNADAATLRPATTYHIRSRVNPRIAPPSLLLRPGQKSTTGISSLVSLTPGLSHNRTSRTTTCLII